MTLHEVRYSLLFVDRKELYCVQFLYTSFLIMVCCKATRSVIDDTVFTNI